MWLILRSSKHGRLMFCDRNQANDVLLTPVVNIPYNATVLFCKVWYWSAWENFHISAAQSYLLISIYNCFLPGLDLIHTGVPFAIYIINQHYLRNNNQCKKRCLVIFLLLEVLLCITCKYMWGLPRGKSAKLHGNF